MLKEISCSEKIPKVSIVIPCYNCAPWIEKCLDALKNQTYEKFEIICVDDCSTDNTIDKIETYKKNTCLDIKLLKNIENVGPAISRNRGVEQAKGKWLSFCDSDDWYEPNFIEEMLNAAENENANLVMCEYRKVFESGKKSKEVHYLQGFNKEASKEDILAYSKASLGLLMVEKKVFSKSAIPDLRNGEDIAYVPCLEANSLKISLVKKTLYNYLIRKLSVSNKSSVKIYQSLLEAYTFIEKQLGNDYPNALVHLGIRTVLYGVTINAFKAGIPSSEISQIVQSFLEKYPNWDYNPYNHTFSRLKRVYLRALGRKHFSICRILAKLHAFLSI